MIGTTAVRPAPSTIPDPEVPTMRSTTIIEDAIATIIEIIRRRHLQRGCTKIVGTRPPRATLAPIRLTLPFHVATRSVGRDQGRGRVTRVLGRALRPDPALSGPSHRPIRTTSSARVRRGCTKAARIRLSRATLCTKVEILAN